MAIFRGIGGAGDSTTDATVTAVTEQAVNAANSATSAATSASAASTSATAAAASAAAAAGSEAGVAADAIAAAASAAAAAASETASAASETAAGASETAAATSASNAATSASSASTSASTATTQATNAASSATTATTKASEAATSASGAATSASNAATSETNAANSATASANSATAAASSAAAAAASFDAFDDIYLGAKSSDPSVDNDGDALTVGDQYFNSVANELRVWNGSSWQAASTVGGTVTNLTITNNPTLSSGTANGVTYLNGSKVLTSGSALTFDGTNLANTGQTTLGGTAQITGAGTPASGAGLELKYTGGRGAVVSYNRAGSAYLGLDLSALNIAFQISGSEGMRLTSTGLGIGTSSPQSKLHVLGTTSDVFRLERDASNQWRFQLSAGALLFSDAIAGTERARIDSAGNLGLGVTPSGWSGSYKALQISSTAAIYSSNNTGLAHNFYVDIGGINRYLTNAAASVYLLDNQHRWFTAPSGTAGNNISFTQAMTLDASGRLGIGTSSPATNLDVSTSSGNTFIRSITTSTTGTALIQAAGDSTQAVVLRTWGTANAGALFGQTIGGWSGLYSDGAASNGLFVGTFTSKPLLFGTANIERARITSSGNVGIGTTSPDTKLNVYGGSLRINNATTGAGSGLIVGMNSNDVFISNQANGYILFGTNNTERARITSSGNLLVGTTSSSGKLTVSGSANSVAVKVTNASVDGNTADVMQIEPSNGAYYGKLLKITSGRSDFSDSLLFLNTSAGINSVNGSYLRVQNSSAQDVFRITGGGNVGIGTSSPGYKLDVQDSVTGNLVIRVKNTNAGASATGRIYLHNDQADNVVQSFIAQRSSTYSISPNSLQIGTTYSHPLIFITSSVERLRIDSSGNLGLGVTPSAWGAGQPALQIGAGTAINSRSAVLSQFSSNQRWDGSNHRYLNNGTATLYTQNDGAHSWATAPSGTAGAAISFTQAMTLDASGNLGIGTSSQGNNKLYVQTPSGQYGSSYPVQAWGYAGHQIFNAQIDGSVNPIFNTDPESYWAPTATMIWQYRGSEKMRIDSSGNLLVGTTSAGNGARQRIATTSASQFGLEINIDNASATGSALLLTQGSAAGTTNKLISGWSGIFGTNAVERFIVFNNGNVQNTNNSYGAISDAKLKENIVDATPKLAKLNQVRVVNFNMIGSEQKQLGVIAQELEQVFPGMVDESPDKDAEGNDLGTTTKSVKYSVFVPMLIKAMQEQQAIINDLKARLDAANL